MNCTSPRYRNDMKTPKRIAFIIRCHSGRPIPDIAERLNISVQKLYALARQHPEIADAIELAREAFIAKVERIAREQLLAPLDLRHIRNRRTRNKHIRKRRQQTRRVLRYIS